MDKILILDFGSQYTQLIARRIRELNVYSEIHPYNNFPSPDADVKGIILSGSPFSSLEDEAPQIDIDALAAHAPVLGICYGAQYITLKKGGTVTRSSTREYGRAHLEASVEENLLLAGIGEDERQVWMSHADTIKAVAPGYKLLASTKDIPVAAFCSDDQNIWGIQFHPEVTHSTGGMKVLKNFISSICKTEAVWTPASFVDQTVSDLKAQLGQDKVILGLSGGVDSTVAAALIHEAIGDNLHCIFVNNGLLRHNEYDEVLERYESLGFNIKGVDASDLFLDALDGVSDPEEKRKIIGKIFVDVFEEESSKVEGAAWLGQGTIYPDVIESISVKGPSATIKSHHNVGGLPDYMKLKVVEPLRSLFKDEVRKTGKSMGLGHQFLGRHPFPGPGLAIRILGEISRDKVRILQEADYIYIEAMKEAGLYDSIWQAGAIFLPVSAVGVMGDERTYENVICLRAVTSLDGMTADWSQLPYDFMASVSNKIINSVRGINRVVYDISSKPPATIEWE